MGQGPLDTPDNLLHSLICWILAAAEAWTPGATQPGKVVLDSSPASHLCAQLPQRLGSLKSVLKTVSQHLLTNNNRRTWPGMVGVGATVE